MLVRGILAFARPRVAMPSVIVLGMMIGLVIDSQSWVLPLAYAFYPERMALLLRLPFALGIASLIDFLPWALILPRRSPLLTKGLC
jgi:hypothetical protein